MRMNVDKAGRHDPTNGVDLVFCLPLFYASKLGDTVSADRDIGLKPRISRTINDGSAADYEIVRFVRGCVRG